jgi:hypothetical protein
MKFKVILSSPGALFLGIAEIIFPIVSQDTGSKENVKDSLISRIACV